MSTVLNYSDQELAAIRAEYAKGSSDDQFTNFIRECRDRNLIPGKHVYFQLRSAKEYDADTRAYVRVLRAAHQTSIDAFRLIAQRSGEYEGQEPFVYIYLDDDGQPNTRSTVPLPAQKSETEAREPWAVEAAVYRKNFKKPITSVARFEAYAVTFKKDNSVKLSDMWARRGPEQLAKCSEALALRQAFPEELSGLYISEELREEREEEAAPQAETKPAEAPKTVTAPAVDHKPAESKVEPRPGEKKEEKKSSRKKTEKKVDKEPESAQQDESGGLDKAEAKLDKEEPKPNLNGYAATDDDLPENMRPGYVPPEEEEPSKSSTKPPEKGGSAKKNDDPDRAPTAEEKQKISQQLKGYKQDSALLRVFILNFSGVDDTKKLTLKKWNALLEHLDAAVQSGTIDKVVGGK